MVLSLGVHPERVCWTLKCSSLWCRWRRHLTTAVSSACTADHQHPMPWTDHTDTTWHSSLAADVTAHHLQNCADCRSTGLAADVRSTWWYVHSYTHRCCTFEITIYGPRRPCRYTHEVDSSWLPQLLRVWSDNWNKLKQDLWSTDTREQFKRGLKRWLFECAYGTRRVWWTLTEGTLYRWTYLLTYWCNVTQSCRRQCLNYVCLAEVMLQL